VPVHLRLSGQLRESNRERKTDWEKGPYNQGEKKIKSQCVSNAAESRKHRDCSQRLVFKNQGAGKYESSDRGRSSVAVAAVRLVSDFNMSCRDGCRSYYLNLSCLPQGLPSLMSLSVRPEHDRPARILAHGASSPAILQPHVYTMIICVHMFET
jgi:hypothetical protein